MCHRSEKKIKKIFTVRIISGSALEKQRSSKCRQSSRKPFLSLQLLAAVTLVDSERCIPHQTYRAVKKKKKHPACCLKSVASARLLPAHRRRLCGGLGGSCLLCRGAEDSNLQPRPSARQGSCLDIQSLLWWISSFPSVHDATDDTLEGVCLCVALQVCRLRRSCVNMPEFALNATVNVFTCQLKRD